MKKAGYLAPLGGLLFFLLCACTPQVSLDTDIDKGNRSNELVEVVINGSFIDSQTRIYPSSEAEQRKARINFNGMRVIFYELDKASETPTKVAYYFDCDINATKGVFRGKDYEIISAESGTFKIGQSMKIKRGNYHVYVIAGLTESIKNATQVGNAFELIKRAMPVDQPGLLDKGVMKSSIYINSQPMVISESALDGISLSDIYTIGNCKLASINAYASVAFEPIINDAKYTMPANFILLFPDVMNKRFVLLPEFHKEVKQILNTDFPIDANFIGFGKKELDTLADDFLYLPLFNEAGADTNLAYSSGKDERQNNFVVIPENTVDADDYFGTVVTRLIVTALIYPSEMNLSGKTFNDPSKFRECPSWILYNGKPFTESEFDAEYKRINALNSKTEEEMNFLLAHNELKGRTQTYPLYGYQSDKIRYFKYGRSYFAIPIQHFTPAQLAAHSTLPGLFATVRNTHYHFNIRSFQSIGAATVEALSRSINYKEIINTESSSIQIEDAHVIQNEIDNLR